MMISSVVRDRLPGSPASAGAAGPVGDAEASVAEAGLERRARGYQRKFRNRSGVLNEVVRVHRTRRAMQPASVASGYQPIRALGSSPAGDEAGREGERGKGAGKRGRS
jgi:hypothetical protein